MLTHKEAKPLLLLVALYLFTVLVPRVLVLPVSNIDWDEYYSALIAQGLLHGQLPFDYVFGGHHPAASYYFYALFLAVFGSSVIAIRTIALACVSAGFLPGLSDLQNSRARTRAIRCVRCALWRRHTPVLGAGIQY
jgi:hypothetical protein